MRDSLSDFRTAVTELIRIEDLGGGVAPADLAQGWAGELGIVGRVQTGRFVGAWTEARARLDDRPDAVDPRGFREPRGSSCPPAAGPAYGKHDRALEPSRPADADRIEPVGGRALAEWGPGPAGRMQRATPRELSLMHTSEPTRQYHI